MYRRENAKIVDTWYYWNLANTTLGSLRWVSLSVYLGFVVGLTVSYQYYHAVILICGLYTAIHLKRDEVKLIYRGWGAYFTFHIWRAPYNRKFSGPLPVHCDLLCFWRKSYQVLIPHILILLPLNWYRNKTRNRPQSWSSVFLKWENPSVIAI